ncbi:UPF0146 family protein [Halorubrum sp. FL23]|uniref:UPF0146 family protein n=1 Tax=Halorubrum sp. FL23 TaxID=3458704 RepID=UPI00403466DF
MVSLSRRALVDELAEHDTLVEVGVGDRPEVARALAERGCRVVAVDIEPGDRTRSAARETDSGSVAGSLRIRRGNVLALADGEPERDAEPLVDESGRITGEAADRVATGADGRAAVDAVYACNLPAEIQRPTVALADRLDAGCVFTTLGFEEPVVPVRRRTIEGTVLYVARDGDREGRSADPV